MAMAGPKIGGLSLLFHLTIIALFYLKNKIRKLISSLPSLSQRIFHPFLQDAK
jgi:hypothetical protein